MVNSADLLTAMLCISVPYVREKKRGGAPSQVTESVTAGGDQTESATASLQCISASIQS